jgi:hypothetical protein
VIDRDEPLEFGIVDECQHDSALLFVFFRDVGLLTEFAPDSVPGDLNPRITDRKWEEGSWHFGWDGILCRVSEFNFIWQK